MTIRNLKIGSISMLLAGIVLCPVLSFAGPVQMNRVHYSGARSGTRPHDTPQPYRNNGPRMHDDHGTTAHH